MKILVLSDSHSSLSFMRHSIETLKPDQVIHLGDHIDDGQAMAMQYPHLRFHLVPGNCDRNRTDPWQPDILCYDVGGVRLYMTHGHRYGVKSDTQRLLAAAREAGAQAVLYGHTHHPECYCRDGLWVMNPGTCGMGERSVGVVETDRNEISACYILSQADI